MPAADSLSALLRPENILVGLAAEDRASVVKALIANLAETGRITKAQIGAASRMINERENDGTTALGNGLAVPHARVFFADPVVAFALLRNGRDFNALDGAPVRFVYLLLTPKSDDDRHMALLGTIMRFNDDIVHRRALAGCLTVEDVRSVFIDYAS